MTTEERRKQPFDVVNRPVHYNSHPSQVETKEITNYLSFNVGNVFKYVMRRDLKEPLRSLQSAQWYWKEHLTVPEVGALLGSADAQAVVRLKLMHIQGMEQRLLDAEFYGNFRRYLFSPSHFNSLTVSASLEKLVKFAHNSSAIPVLREEAPPSNIQVDKLA